MGRASIGHILLAASLAVGVLPRAGRGVAPPESPPAADALAWTIGRWEGERIEAGTGIREPIATEVASVLAGAGEEERIEVGRMGKLYRGLYLQVFDPALKKSVLIYVNAARREFARLEGTAGPDRAVWLSTTARAPRGSRLTYERIDTDRWRRTQEISMDSGAHWTVLFVDEMHRATGSADGRSSAIRP